MFIFRTSVTGLFVSDNNLHCATTIQVKMINLLTVLTHITVRKYILHNTGPLKAKSRTFWQS